MKTLGRASYFISIIKEFSPKVWVYVFKTKDQALQTFMKLRTDDGWEFCSDHFTKFCKACEMNITLLEHVRYMFLYAGLGKQFCGEAFTEKTDSYPLNRCPSAAW